MARFLRKYVLITISLFMVLLTLSGCGQSATSAPAKEKPKTLFAYVGANLKDPVTELANDYEKKTGVKVELTFNNSGSLLNQIETVKTGDIYMPGSMPFVKKAKDAGLLDQVVGPVAYHTPIIIVPSGNPAQIHGLKDIAKSGVQLIIPDPEATALGKTIYNTFKKAGILEAAEKNVIATMETPAKVVAAIVMGQGNAGIVEYSNTAKAGDKIEKIEIEPEFNHMEEIPVATIAASQNKEQAADFMNYVKENGPGIFKKYGFKTK